MSLRSSSHLSSQAVLAVAFLIAIPGIALAAVYYHRMFDPKHGGSVCYHRIYSDAFLKKHPDVKLEAISLERRSSVSDVTPNSKKKFGVTFQATTKSENYTALADCKPQGSVVACSLESDGGTFTFMRAGKGVVIKTRRIQVEGLFKDLDISSKRGKPTRSFTLKGSGTETCEAVFD
jgi:hypothetical protein